MNARLATADDRILAGTAKAGTNHDQATKPHNPHPERMEVAFENVYILIHEGEIPSKEDLLPLLAQITKSGKPLLIIAEDVGDEAPRISIDKSNMLVVGERFRTKASPQQELRASRAEPGLGAGTSPKSISLPASRTTPTRTPRNSSSPSPILREHYCSDVLIPGLLTSQLT